MSEIPSRTTSAGTPSRLTRPIVIAGLLGGLLGGLFGGVVSFAASRLIKPASPPPAPTAKALAIEEARHIVEEFIAILKAGKRDEFMTQVKTGYTFLHEKDYEAYKQKYDNFRIEVLHMFGSPLHEFELLHETASSPDLIEFVYLEKFEHGPIVWRFIMYRGKESWRLAYLDWFINSHEGFVQ